MFRACCRKQRRARPPEPQCVNKLLIIIAESHLTFDMFMHHPANAGSKHHGFREEREWRIIALIGWRARPAIF
jgi:hypothetical protein